jgi:hypothetical protein
MSTITRRIDLKNYYKILNVDILATQSDIKKSYRSLAKQYHPDKNPENPDSEIIFQDIREAYDVLSDPVERTKYDKNFKYFVSGKKSTKKKENPVPTYNSKAIWIKTGTILSILCILISLLLISQYAYLQHKNNSIKPGMTVLEIAKIYGEPDAKNEDALFYGTAIIHLDNDDKVLYWYNAYDSLTIQNKRINDIDMISIDSPIEDIFHEYGYPDTYAKTFLVYYDVIVMYKNNRVVDVYKLNQ